MAKVTVDGISGLVGTVVMYNMNGKSYVRSRPKQRKKKRGADERPENTIFGIVSKYGTRMIKGISQSFLFPFGLATYNTLRGWMHNQYAAHKDEALWELTAKRNSICQLNPEADLRDFIGMDLLVTDKGNGKLEVLFPSLDPGQDIKAPLRTKNINIKILASTATFGNTAYPNYICLEQYNLDYNGGIVPAKNIVLDTKAITGDIGILLIALEFETKDSGQAIYNTERRWLPAAIIAMGKLK